MIAARNFLVFNQAAENGQLDLLRYFERKAPTKLPDMISANNYKAFSSAAKNNHIDILHYLEEKAPEKFQAMIAASNYEAFREAGKNEHLDLLYYLESKVAPHKLQEMLAADNFDLFRTVWSCESNDVAKHLLSYSSVFAFAEEHHAEYGERLIIPHVREQLALLRSQKQAFEHAHPNAVFDINAEEANKLFYYARHLIRCNDASRLDDLLFLLEIPSVKAQAALAHREGHANELLRLSLSLNNQMAAELLITIPTVRQLAEANNYYAQEQRGGIALRQVARDQESSMTALSQGEQQRLKRVTDRYQPRVNAIGVEQCMNNLRGELVGRYLTNPARIDVPGQVAGQTRVLNLPLIWTDFKKLNLSEPYYTKALQAYYQNSAHSALRYLSKPNPWMHERAGYVNVNPQNHQEKWSTFEEYQPFISLLYLATKDAQTPATDGYTLETRFTHFIEELAFIGRAHNWDDTRIKLNEKRQAVLDKQGLAIQEEYDNLQGDRPSCFSGVKRRLFQAVQGHPLLVFLTKEVLTQEANNFIRDYFKAAINETNRTTIKGAWDKLIVGDNLTNNDWKALKQIDIPQQKQEELINKLNQKYGSQFSEDIQLKLFIHQMFVFKKVPDAHLLNFGHLKLEQFFKVNSLQAGFFAEATRTQVAAQASIGSMPASR